VKKKMPKKVYIKKQTKRGRKITSGRADYLSHDDIKKKIVRKVGKRPRLSKNLPQGEWTPQALRVLSERYLVRDDGGNVVETPEEMSWRIAWEIASAEALWGLKKKQVEKLARQFYLSLVTREFLPNSPTLMNAGTNNNLQYSGCYVVPVEDSMEGIFDAIKCQALIHKSGGGTGFAFSRLRPRGSVVKSSRGIASGPVSFMRIFDAATNEVKQGGKRRGANMGILRIDHPDIKEFIHCKEEGGVTNFNISVAITDKFIKAYEKDEDYELYDPKNGDVVGKLNAREVFDEIAEAAWKTGDPGLVFIDRINSSKANPVPSLGPIESTNPCGEQPLYPYDACNLGSIFLNRLVRNTAGEKTVDWKKLKEITSLAVRFLDNVIEVNPYPLQDIRKTVFDTRRIGLGVGGWADLLVELGIPYDSEEAIKLAEKVMKTIQKAAVKESERLAKTRGTFPLWKESIYQDKKPRRNSTVTTIAPTGTISIIAGASSGIEPIFAVAYQHVVRDKHLDRTLNFVNPKFKDLMQSIGGWTEEIENKVVGHGVIREMDEIPKDVRDIFATAHEISPEWHIKMQSAFQKHTENAVSKTINMNNTATVEDIKKAYLLSWETGCKGITVFRDGCKDMQVLNLGIQKDGQRRLEADNEATQIRPLVASGSTYKLDTPVGVAFITINQDKTGEPMEVFVNVGKAGSDVTAMAEALGRMISTALRFRGYLGSKDRAEEIAHQLSGIGGRRSVGFGPKKILSLPDAVAVALSMHFNFKINGYTQSMANGEVNVYADKGHPNGVVDGEPENSVKSELVAKPDSVGTKSDLAGAVMLAQNSDNMSVQNLRVDDHTTASAESNSASVGSGTLNASSGNSHTKPISVTHRKVNADICPSCGASALVYEEGCSKCHFCGHSEC
jgi:ribonucleoside-diphosphate reductase alpha chain